MGFICLGNLPSMTTRMARKTKEDTQKTITAILDAAERVFLEKGVAHATMANIADSANVSRGAVYGHYKDKMEVCVAVCQRAMDESRQITEAVPGETPMAALRRVGIVYLQTIHTSASLKNALEIIYMKCEQTPEFAPIQVFREIWEKKTLKTTEKLIRRAITAGELPARSAIKVATIYLNTLLEGISMQLWFTELLQPDPWQKAERFIGAGIDSLLLSEMLLKSNE